MIEAGSAYVLAAEADITSGADQTRIEEAKRAAERHPDALLPALPYTEARWEWVLLYDHARRGQIHPATMRKMERADLEYLADMTTPAADITSDEAAKLLGNV